MHVVDSSPVCNGEGVEIVQSGDDLCRVEQSCRRREPEIRTTFLSNGPKNDKQTFGLTKEKATEVLQNLRGNKYSLGETAAQKGNK